MCIHGCCELAGVGRADGGSVRLGVVVVRIRGITIAFLHLIIIFKLEI